MKKYFTLFLLVSVVCIAQTVPNDMLYLGQTPPGETPITFDLSTTNGLRPVERIAITSDGKEIYYSELNTWPPTDSRIKCYKYVNNKWEGPTIVFEGYVAPGLSVNDSVIYMEKDVAGISCTFFSERNSNGWSTPAKFYSTNLPTHYFQKTKLNNSFLSSTSQGSFDICKLIDNTQIQTLGAPINTSETENDFFIAQDESFLIFIRFGSSSASDLYISFKKENGTWTNPKKFGTPINASDPNWECCPYVSNDNKYLFFTRGDINMSSYYTYWVKIDNIIDSLRITNYTPYLKNQITAQTAEVGKIFSYTTPANTFIDDDGNNTLTYSAALSDGTVLPAWLTFNPATKAFTGTPKEAVNLSVKVTVIDKTGADASCTFNINIANYSKQYP